MSIKLIAIDIDGTLIADDHTITPATKQAIQTATQQGINIVLCTGRPLTGVTSYLDELELNHQNNEYVISYNGSLAQTTAGKTLAKYTVPVDDMIDLGAFALKHGLKMILETATTLIATTQQIDQYAVHESKLVSLPLMYQSLDQLSAQKDHLEISKLMITGPKDDLDQVLTTIPDELAAKFNIVRSEDFYLEFINPAASKGNALQLMGTELGIDQSEMMALGNAQNDESMLAYAGIGVAMGNSIPSTKAVADYLTDDNNHDGVGKAIEKFALN